MISPAIFVHIASENNTPELLFESDAVPNVGETIEIVQRKDRHDTTLELLVESRTWRFISFDATPAMTITESEYPVMLPAQPAGRVSQVVLICKKIGEYR